MRTKSIATNLGRSYRKSKRGFTDVLFPGWFPEGLIQELDRAGYGPLAASSGPWTPSWGLRPWRPLSQGTATGRGNSTFFYPTENIDIYPRNAEFCVKNALFKLWPTFGVANIRTQCQLLLDMGGQFWWFLKFVFSIFFLFLSVSICLGMKNLKYFYKISLRKKVMLKFDD